VIVIILALIGGAIGYRTASKRGGNRLDKLQYTVIYALAFAIIGLFATVILERVL